MLTSSTVPGLPEEIVIEAQKAMIAGDHGRAETIIARYQEQAKAQLREQGIDIDSIPMFIGRDCKWSDILRQVFRVVDFNRTNTTIGPNGRPKAESHLVPYGYLSVESPILNRSVWMPIIHGDDYLLASFVFDNPHCDEMLQELELLVTYAPKWTFFGGRTASTRHVLHYVLCPCGTLEQYYDTSGVHVNSPKPEKLFGKFVYHGETTVKINQNPELDNRFT